MRNLTFETVNVLQTFDLMLANEIERIDGECNLRMRILKGKNIST